MAMRLAQYGYRSGAGGPGGAPGIQGAPPNRPANDNFRHYRPNRWRVPEGPANDNAPGRPRPPRPMQPSRKLLQFLRRVGGVAAAATLAIDLYEVWKGGEVLDNYSDGYDPNGYTRDFDVAHALPLTGSHVNYDPERELWATGSVPLWGANNPGNPGAVAHMGAWPHANEGIVPAQVGKWINLMQYHQNSTDPTKYFYYNRLRWYRSDLSTNLLPLEWPLTSPTILPVANPAHWPLEWYYPSVWPEELPILRPSPQPVPIPYRWAAPKFRPQVNPAPRPIPRPQPGTEVGPNNIPRFNTGGQWAVEISAHGARHVNPRGRRPPLRGEKQRKMILGVRAGTALAIGLNAATELLDFGEVLWQSLPDHLKSKGPRGEPSYPQKLRDLYQHINEVDWTEFWQNWAENNAEDAGWGRLGTLQSEANQNMSGQGAHFGPAL